MKTPTQLTTISAAAVASSAFLLSGCAAIEGIFKAGLWVGALAIVGLVVVVGGAVALLRRR